MTNIYIGNPHEAIVMYGLLNKYRSLQTMTDDECKIILGLALDNDDWNGDAINHMKITSKHSNFIEGNLSFGKKDTYLFTIRYDGTVDVRLMEYDEKKTTFVPSKTRLPIYRAADVIIYMMRRGLDIFSHLMV